MHASVLRCTSLVVGWAAAVVATATVPAPREHFGFAIGDDYELANYTETEAYFQKLAAASDRVKLVDIGRTEEGRTQWMLAITAPENQRTLAQRQEISRTLARAENVSEAQARALAAEGRAVVWIDGGLHADETVATHQLIETAWQLASADDAETQRILRETIVLLVHANPDGHELVSDWYRREPEPKRRVLTPTPRLYQKYVGHDNNRDFFLSAMKETTNLNRQLYLEWLPQIVLNHHQTAPVGTVMFVPPFRDPFNYHFDPLVILGVEALGNAMQTRLLLENKMGATTREGANYSTWFNGALRTTVYFHNMIGLLAEIAGGPTPSEIALVPRRQLPSNNLPAPVAPQPWHFRQSIDYAVTANRGVLDYAARNREALLYNIYRMGRNSIERGSRDHWTPQPDRIEAIARRAASERGAKWTEDRGDTENPRPDTTARIEAHYWQQLRAPEWRDPRGFIVPADQPDFPTAVKFINALVKSGIAIHRATSDFTVAGKKYPAGSYVVKTDQAFRPHVMDMFEPQDHPNDFESTGGMPAKPYDIAGWTLALQMGVKFDRVLDQFDGPFERVPYGELQAPPAESFDARGVGFLVSRQANDTARLANRLLKRRAETLWLDESPRGPGALYVPNRGVAGTVVAEAAAELGLRVRAVDRAPTGGAWRLAPVRIALWDKYGGSIPSGWTRWILEQFEFSFDVIYSPEIDAGKLHEKYDAIILVNGALPARGRDAETHPPVDLPSDHAHRVGRLTEERSIPALRDFLHGGGTIVAIGSSTRLASRLGLPIENALVENSAGGMRELPEEKFFVPGSLLEARIATENPLAWGMPERANVYFDRSPAFRLPTRTARSGLTAIAWFDTPTPLRSGWAPGQARLDGTVVVATVAVGRGKLHLMGAEVAFRGQTHGTFKLLFNALHLATASAVSLPDPR